MYDCFMGYEMYNLLKRQGKEICIGKPYSLHLLYKDLPSREPGMLQDMQLVPKITIRDVKEGLQLHHVFFLERLMVGPKKGPLSASIHGVTANPLLRLSSPWQPSKSTTMRDSKCVPDESEEAGQEGHDVRRAGVLVHGWATGETTANKAPWLGHLQVQNHIWESNYCHDNLTF